MEIVTVLAAFFFFFDRITVLAALLGDKVGKLPSLPLNASFKSKAV